VTFDVSRRPVPSGSSDSAVLDAFQSQNVAAVAQAPGVVGTPTSDRLSLPIGETVRVRWRIQANNLDLSSIGYGFIKDGYIYTLVFTCATGVLVAEEPVILQIVESFTLR
jgi:hypothetical protein